MPNEYAETGRLIGKWRLVDAEGELDLGNDVVVEFFEDGRLEYRISEGETISVINLTFRVSGDELITDQPTSPRIDHTRFSFQDDGLLVLATSTSRSWFDRLVEAV